MIPKNRRPTTPGEVLVEEFLKPLGMTQRALSDRLGVPIQRINTLANGRRGVSPETAILLSRAFDTTPQFWLNLQNNVDLWDAEQKMAL